MSTTETRLARMARAFALVGALALMIALLPSTLASAQQQPAGREAFGVNDLNAEDNIGASISWSNATFTNGSQQAVLGRNDVFADNLASGTLQRLNPDGLPLLLTESNQLSERTRNELQRLGVQVVHVLGGEAAIAPAVVNELQQMGIQIHRHAGTTRIETAIDIAQRHFGQSNTAILARAYGTQQDPTAGFADSLAAGGWGAETGFPILLTLSEELPESLRTFLQNSAIQRIFVVGGEAAIAPAVVNELQQMGITVERVAGETRFGTAVQIAQQRGFPSAQEAPRVILVPGVEADAWASGFPAAANSALNNGPIVLSAQGQIPVETEQWLQPGGLATFLVCAPFTEEPACERAAELLEKPFAELDALTVQPGGEITGRFEGEVTNPLVTGCGFQDEAVEVDANDEFGLTFGQDVEEGECELIFTAQSGGEELTTEFLITVGA